MKDKSHFESCLFWIKCRETENSRITEVVWVAIFFYFVLILGKVKISNHTIVQFFMNWKFHFLIIFIGKPQKSPIQRISLEPSCRNRWVCLLNKPLLYQKVSLVSELVLCTVLFSDSKQKNSSGTSLNETAHKQNCKQH